jgi:3-oxoacyl-[acyl-carrier protein] reductase
MNLGLQNKTALVAASSKGIGKACAEALIQEGCRVMISSSNKDNLISASKEFSAQYNTEVLWHECNVKNTEEIRSTVGEAVNALGKIDILINNCGGPLSGPIESFSDDDWTNAFNEVLMSAVRFSREVSEIMKQNKFGRIINITSISVKQPIQRLVLSNSLRSGVTAFAKTLSTELAPFNITVNNIAPGYTLTNRIYDLALEQAKTSNISYEEVLKNFTKDIPMGRMAKPEEIGSLAAFLCSEKAAYITGQTIAVDGGYVKGIF